MALNIFILLTLLMVALSTSQDVGPLSAAAVAGGNVEVEAAIRECWQSDYGGCLFGGTCRRGGSILTEACLQLQCLFGTWYYFEGDINPNCGECSLKGDPHITTFDKSLTKSRNGETITPKYILKRGGHYVISQPDFNVPASYGVSGKLENCDWLPSYNGSCIYEASYHEPGIEMKLILPRPDIAPRCTNGTPDQDPECDIKVLVNGQNFTIGNSVEYFIGLNGAILVFKHNDIGEDNLNLNCITIVGSKGLSVSLCEYKNNLPYFYVWALPSLKSKLLGLCNTFTGADANLFVLQDKTLVLSEDCLTYTPSDGAGWKICEQFTESWKFPIG